MATSIGPFSEGRIAPDLMASKPLALSFKERGLDRTRKRETADNG